MQWNSDDRTSGGFMSSTGEYSNKPWLPTNKNFKDLNVEVMKLKLDYFILNYFKLYKLILKSDNILIQFLDPTTKT
jgi:hypothetical protein